MASNEDAKKITNDEEIKDLMIALDRCVFRGVIL